MRQSILVIELGSKGWETPRARVEATRRCATQKWARNSAVLRYASAEFVSRWMERCCAGSNATSPTTDGLGEDEPRGWDYFSGASEQRGAVLLVTSRVLTIKSDRHAVCGRKTVVWRIFHQ